MSIKSSIKEEINLRTLFFPLKSLLKQEQSNVSLKSMEEIEQLKAQLGKQEREYNERGQAYIINLNGMKEKVKAVMTEKDKQIAQLKKKLQNKLNKFIKL